MRKLPIGIDLNTIDILIQLNKANYNLGELNGIVRLLPNPTIILNAITLGEAKDSSEIENIFTTFDDLYKEIAVDTKIPEAKEVVKYREAINSLFYDVKKRGFISLNSLIETHHIIEPNKGDIRKTPGTHIKNIKTNEIIYTPPQSKDEILDYMDNLIYYINEDSIYDPLIDMALIHYQFEAIHPFYDGNGRLGRIINIIFLHLKNKLDLPIIYLSKYIIENKMEYYSLIREVQEDYNNLPNFILYILKGVEQTALFTINYINDISQQILVTKNKIKEELPKIYSNELVDAIFEEFYTKTETLSNKLAININTARKYLDLLVDIDILTKERVGKEMVYKNNALFNLTNNW